MEWQKKDRVGVAALQLSSAAGRKVNPIRFQFGDDYELWKRAEDWLQSGKRSNWEIVLISLRIESKPESFDYNTEWPV